MCNLLISYKFAASAFYDDVSFLVIEALLRHRVAKVQLKEYEQFFLLRNHKEMLKNFVVDDENEKIWFQYLNR